MRLAPRRPSRFCCLEPYSPDLNPIEQSFAEFKAHLRKARQRTVSGLYDQIGKTHELFALAECRNYFINSGYA
jgi:transposase